MDAGAAAAPDDAADPAADPVEELFEQLSRVVDGLTLMGEPSLAIRVSEVASKSLLMAAASRFEAEITSLIAEMASAMSNAPLVAEFCINQGVTRKFHTLFSWEASNANLFFRLFGDDFATTAKERVAADEELATAIKAFLEIGSDRNTLAHSDFVSYPLTLTLTELIEQYRRARYFVTGLRELFFPAPPQARASSENSTSDDAVNDGSAATGLDRSSG